MKANEVGFAAVVTLALGIAFGLELNTAFWASWVIPYFAVFTFMGLLLLGGVLHVSGRVLGRATIGYLVVLALLWYLPLNTIERFFNDVEQVHVGMSAADVEAIMAGQVKWAPLAESDDGSVTSEQPVTGTTYYKPRGRHDSFDTCLAVRWQGGQVSDLGVYRD